MHKRENPAITQVLSWPWLLAVLSAAFVCYQSSYLFIDPDTLWHIRAGEWIWLHQRVPTADIFSHTFNGKPWISHEWLASLTLYLFYSTFSWAGITGLIACAFSLAIGLIARFLFDRLEPIRALLVTLFVVQGLASHLLARPHVLAMPMLAFWVIQCANAAESDRRPSAWLPVWMCVWANIHASFLAGLAIAFFFAAEAFLTSPLDHRRQVAKGWAIFLALAVIACLATPHHIQSFLFPLQIQEMSYTLAVIGEWRSPNFQQFQAQEIWILGLLVFGWLLRVQIHWSRLALLLVVMHLSLVHTRHLTLLAIVGSVIMARPIQNALSRFPPTQTNAIDRLMHRLNHPARYLFAIPLFALVLWGSAYLFARDAKPPSYNLPIAAIDFLRANPQSGKLFNSYGYGGALIFSGIPVYVDGRADVYGDTFIKQVFEAVSGRPGKLQDLLDRNNISWTFLEASSPASQILDLLPGWEKLYRDEDVAIHRKLHHGN